MLRFTLRYAVHLKQDIGGGRMKAKQVIALLLVLVLCVPFAAYAAGGDTTVYITDTGSKYHRSSCGSLWNSSSAATLQQALNWGYEPCQKCNPPAYIAAPTPSKTIEERLQAMRESAPEPTKTVQERINSLIEEEPPSKKALPEWLTIILGLSFGSGVIWLFVGWFGEIVVDWIMDFRWKRRK